MVKNKYTYQFIFKPKTFLFCLLFTLLFCLMSVWQLHRYFYKKDLLSKQQTTALSPPLLFTAINKNNQNTLQFKNIIVEGYYDNHHTLLLTNKFYRNQLGFEVLTPLKIAGEKRRLLIDRGWVKALENQIPPVIPQILSKQRIKGYIKLLHEYQFILGKNIFYPDQSPLMMQKIDFAEISHMTHQLYYPFILRLDPNQPNGFVRDWVIVFGIPERHLGYTVQWLLMAIATCVAYFYFSIRRLTKQTSP